MNSINFSIIAAFNIRANINIYGSSFVGKGENK